jgi:hypothetical protein
MQTVGRNDSVVNDSVIGEFEQKVAKNVEESPIIDRCSARLFEFTGSQEHRDGPRQ